MHPLSATCAHSCILCIHHQNNEASHRHLHTHFSLISFKDGLGPKKRTFCVTEISMFYISCLTCHSADSIKALKETKSLILPQNHPYNSFVVYLLTPAQKETASIMVFRLSNASDQRPELVFETPTVKVLVSVSSQSSWLEVSKPRRRPRANSRAES